MSAPPEIAANEGCGLGLKELKDISSCERMYLFFFFARSRSFPQCRPGSRSSQSRNRPSS